MQMKIRPLEAELFNADGQLIVAIRNFCELAWNRKKKNILEDT
jgi:hypothetical protein